MKRPHALLLIPLLVATLTACDLFSKFVPPIEVGNVFGIGSPDNPTTLKAPAFQDPNDLGTFKPAALGAIDFERETIVFSNIELPNMHGFSLDALWITIGLGDTITLERESPSATFPPNFNLTAFEAYLNIEDAQNIRKPAEYHFKENTLNLKYERQGNCATGDTCTYKATASKNELESAMLFHIPESDGQVVKDLMTIISEGGANFAHVKVRLTADAPNGTLTGLKPTFQISNPSTKVSVGR